MYSGEESVYSTKNMLLSAEATTKSGETKNIEIIFVFVRKLISFYIFFPPSSSLMIVTHCDHFFVLRPFTNFTVLLNARDIGMFFFFSVFLLLFFSTFCG